MFIKSLTPKFVDCLFDFQCAKWGLFIAEKSFENLQLSVVRRRRCRKLFTFASSSPEQQGQIQPNLGQSILWYREFKFVQMKGPAL